MPRRRVVVPENQTPLYLCFTYFQFPGDLGVRQIQSHEVEAKHPIAQRAMMTGRHRVGQIIERPATIAANIVLTVGLFRIMSVFDGVVRVAMGAFDSFGPTKLLNHLIAFGVVDQSVNVNSHPA